MAYNTQNGISTIRCDKCGTSDSINESIAGDFFFDEGWGLYPNAKKYKHVCRACQPAKHRKSHDFVAKRLNNRS